jgi:hypothetical protein
MSGLISSLHVEQGAVEFYSWYDDFDDDSVQLAPGALVVFTVGEMLRGADIKYGKEYKFLCTIHSSNLTRFFPTFSATIPNIILSAMGFKYGSELYSKRDTILIAHRPNNNFQTTQPQIVINTGVVGGQPPYAGQPYAGQPYAQQPQPFAPAQQQYVQQGYMQQQYVQQQQQQFGQQQQFVQPQQYAQATPHFVQPGVQENYAVAHAVVQNDNKV